MTKEILKYAAEYISDKDIPLENRAEIKLAFINGCDKILSLQKKVTDDDIHNYVERTYFHHPDSVIWAFKDGAKWMRSELQNFSEIPTKPYLKVFLDWFLKWQHTQSLNPSFEKILESFKNSNEYKEFAKSINVKK